MKYIVVLILSLVSFTAFADGDGLTIDPFPVFSAGGRFGDNSINSGSTPTLGVDCNWLSIGEDTTISFLSPGLNFQTADNTLAPSLGIVSITTRTDFNFSIKTFPVSDPGQVGGLIGISIGWAYR